MHLDKGQRASQKTKQKDISLKTEMFIKDNCRLPPSVEADRDAASGLSRIHLDISLCSSLDR